MGNIPEKKKYGAHNKKWPAKNLGEVMGFLENIFPDGVSGKTLAADLGQTPQSISGLFCKDDMHLSKAEEIARIYGYELKIFYPIRKQYDWFTPPPPKNTFPNAGNLEGLVQYVNDAGWSIRFASQRMNKDPNIVWRAFNNGDIKISTLKQMLDALGICAIWKFIPKQELIDN